MEGAVRVANKGLAEACFCDGSAADFVRVARKGLSEKTELKMEGTELHVRGRSGEMGVEVMGNGTTRAGELSIGINYQVVPGGGWGSVPIVDGWGRSKKRRRLGVMCRPFARPLELKVKANR